MKRLLLDSIVFGTLCCLLPGFAACGAGYGKEEFHVENGKLLRGAAAWQIIAIEAPRLAHPDTTAVELATALNKAAEVGANGVWFDLYGFDQTGKHLSDKAIDALNEVVHQVKWRRMGAVCRVLGGDAPSDPKARKNAVRTAAKALHAEAKLVYWIDGPDAAKLSRQFKKRAPRLCVAGPEGAQVKVISDPTVLIHEGPALLLGVLPPPDSKAGALLPHTQQTFAAVDNANIDPIELQPWTPDNSILTDQERADGWIALFDGKTLDGWTITGVKDAFVVKDGAIQWAKLGGSYIRTRDRYDNFILRLDWKIEKGGNSGIFLRAPRAARASKIGMEFQIMGDHGQPTQSKGTGALYDALAPLANPAKPEGQWNTLEITLDGPHLKATLNGTPIHDTNLDHHQETQARLRRGFIGLQDHGHPVAFRNIRLKPL